MPLNLPASFPRNAIAVLFSGGVESGILAGVMSDYCIEVYPLYISFGLSWERAEIANAKNYLSSLDKKGIRQLIVLDMPVADAYSQHWSITGNHIPDATTPDEAVYLPGRNLLLVSKAAVWCSLNSVRAVAIGSLVSNPFPDASNKFIELLEQTIRTSFNEPFQILCPCATMHKNEVMHLGTGLPLHLTFSCINPVFVAGNLPMHCGQCSKCAERQDGFAEAGIKDKTQYANYAYA